MNMSARSLKKCLKNAQADRIVNSLRMKLKPYSPSSKKIKKRKRFRHLAPPSLMFETKSGLKKKVTFILNKSTLRPSKPSQCSNSVSNVKTSAVKPKANPNSNYNEVDYGLLFGSVYKAIQKQPGSHKTGDKASTDATKIKKDMFVKKNDMFGSIEYDPGNNFYHLVGRGGQEKMALFENQSMKPKKSDVNEFFINLSILQSLKQNFQLDTLFS